MRRIRGPSDEEAFLASYRPSDFARPAVAVDIVALTVLDSLLQVLVVKRAEPPFRGRWAFPGGFVRVGDKETAGESLEEAMGRELFEETGLSTDDVYVEQLGAFGDTARPRQLQT